MTRLLQEVRCRFGHLEGSILGRHSRQADAWRESGYSYVDRDAVSSTLGLLGSPAKPMIIPWLLNRNGQAITLKTELKQYGVKLSSAPLKAVAAKQKASGNPMTFAMTFPPGTHAMWMRYWLAAGGIHPDKDIALITIPPAQMIANMKGTAGGRDPGRYIAVHARRQRRSGVVRGRSDPSQSCTGRRIRAWHLGAAVGGESHRR